MYVKEPSVFLKACLGHTPTAQKGHVWPHVLVRKPQVVETNGGVDTGKGPHGKAGCGPEMETGKVGAARGCRGWDICLQTRKGKIRTTLLCKWPRKTMLYIVRPWGAFLLTCSKGKISQQTRKGETLSHSLCKTLGEPGADMKCGEHRALHLSLNTIELGDHRSFPSLGHIDWPSVLPSPIREGEGAGKGP